MPKVIIKYKQIFIGNKSIPLISGEVHYWRLNPGYWTNTLASVREMGLKVISTYVPWHYHEYPRGQFDFRGRTNPSRDLVGFLKLAQKEKFHVVLRPGPYIYSEWPNDGVPDYAFEYHRLHPQFLKYAEIYLREVAREVKPFLASRGGPILLVQADNEIDPWPDRFGHQYGLNRKAGLFQGFLKELYHRNIHEMNEAWGTNYNSFDDAGPFIATMFANEKGLALKGDQELRRNLDYFKFKYDYSKRYAEWAVKTFRKLGFDVPLYLNVYPFFYAHEWTDFQKTADFIGVDLYPTNEFHEDAYEHRKMIDKVRYLANVSALPFIAEFESGIWHERQYETGAFTPNHYRLTVLSALMAGAAGWNWYMLVNRDNWYMSPINEWGRKRQDLFEVFKQLTQLHSEMEPATALKLTDLAVTFNPLQYAAKTISHDNPLLRALYDEDIDYDVVDVRSENMDRKFLIYSGNQWLDEASQRNLRRYVEKGGVLIAFRDYPRKDEQFRACSLVGFDEPKSILFEFKKKIVLRFDADHSVEVISSAYTFEAERGRQEITAAIEPYGKLILGYIQKIGKGKIVHLGVEPHPILMKELLSFLGVSFASRSRTTGVKTALFQKGKRYYLIAVNNGNENKTVSVELPALSSFRKITAKEVTEDAEIFLAGSVNQTLNFELPRKDGKLFILQPNLAKSEPKRPG